jgi:hypothetical protein
VPYDAGFALVRHGQQHLETFAVSEAYLRREFRGGRPPEARGPVILVPTCPEASVR